MVTVCSVVVFYDGNHITTRWKVEADAHAVGLTADLGRGRYIIGDDLGTPQGAAVVAHALHSASRSLAGSVARQWGTPHLW